MRLERFAALVELDRGFERDRAFLQLVDDRLELGQRRLERHFGDVGGGLGHGGSSRPAGGPVGACLARPL